MLVQRIWSKQPGRWFCLASIKKMGAGEKPKLHWIKSTLVKAELAAKLDELNAQKLNVFFCPHGFTKKRRLKKYAVPGHIIYADDAPFTTPIEPTWRVESSPGKHYGFWWTDEVADESTNQAWTYLIGADAGGWDHTQLLRVPGSRNRKPQYGPKFPLVRTKGGSDKQVKLSDIRALLPRKKRKTDADASDVYSKWEGKLKASTRQALLASKTGGEDRSRVLWRLNKELLEAGVPSLSVFRILRTTVWNKFRDRPDGDQQLKKELAKSVKEKLGSAAAVYVPELFAKSMEEVELEQYDWLWYPYLARREMTILEGDPGVGKSWLIHSIAAKLASGKAHTLPSPKPKKHKPLMVVFFDGENPSGVVMKPRLIANGCTRMDKIYQEEQPLNMLDEGHITAINERLAELKPDLVIFDTLSKYLGETDPNNTVSVAQALQQFVGLARRLNAAVCVVRHMNKGKEKALYRGQGSITFTGTARVCISVGWSDQSADERLFAVNKINVAKMPPARAYSLRDIGDDMAVLEFGEERKDLSADDIISLQKFKSEVDTSVDEWLEHELESGETNSAKIIEAGSRRGYNESNVMAAARRLKVESKQSGFGSKKRVDWKLPKPD